MKKRSGERTLLASVLMSAPGPIVVGAALYFGRSSTQLADFIRRSAELIAIIISFMVYRRIQRSKDITQARMTKLERFANVSVGLTMCISAPVILFAAFYSSNTENGNVIPGLIIALLGVVTNTWFWLRYRKLNLSSPNAIFAVQSSLYRAKSLVDICVVTALAAVAAAPGAPLTRFVDLGGSLIVAGYLMVNGIITIRGKKNALLQMKGSIDMQASPEDAKIKYDRKIEAEGEKG